MNWIPMRIDLHGDPSTIAIANTLKVSTNETVGLLLLFWAWADSHLVNGYAEGVTFSNIDVIVSVTGFAQAVADAGWLRQNKGGILMVNFDNWLSKSAKNRIKTGKRMKKMRDGGGVTKASPHNITLHNNKSLSKDSKELARSHMLPQAEQIYQAYPLKKGKKTAIKAILKALKEKTVEELLQAVAKYSLEMKGSEYIKHPATWFNAGCWDDEAAPKGNAKPEGVDVATGRIYPKKGKYEAYE